MCSHVSSVSTDFHGTYFKHKRKHLPKKVRYFQIHRRLLRNDTCASNSFPEDDLNGASTLEQIALVSVKALLRTWTGGGRGSQGLDLSIPSIQGCDCSVQMASADDAYQGNDSLKRDIDRIFNHIDANLDGSLDIQEVAALFQQLAPDQGTQSAYNAAVEALLLTDANLDAKLDKHEFYQLFTKVSALAGKPVTTTVRLLLTAIQPDPGVTAAEESAANHQEPAISTRIAQNSEDVLTSSSKMKELFCAWDRTGDGSVNFNELCQGLARFKPHLQAQDTTAIISEAASILAKHDGDGDRRLQYDEFATFLAHFMHAAGYSLSEVLDELMQVAQRPDSRKLQTVLDNAQPQIEDVLSKMQQ